ncbi:MAG: AAA family ATPase [Chlamydiia bacterium]
MVQLPASTDNFRQLREEGMLYVDKTGWIRELETLPKELLITRPRRFGKTLWMSMLASFYDLHRKADEALFEGLRVYEDRATWEAHAHKYPVLSLSFKAAEGSSWQETEAKLRRIVQEEVMRHLVQEGEALSSVLRKELYNLQNIPLIEQGVLVRQLCHQLRDIHGRRVVVLIDEYDAPLISSIQSGCFDQALRGMRSFLSDLMKGGDFRQRGILTGVYHYTKDAMASSLNNVSSDNILDPRLSAACGFTPEEVKLLVEETGTDITVAKLQEWYNGYRFRDSVIYNPYSIINCLEKKGRCNSYWMGSGSEGDLVAALRESSPDMQANLNALVEGGSVRVPLTGVLQIGKDQKFIGAATRWSLLVHSGYLTATEVETGTGDAYSGVVLIPNQEVRGQFAKLVQGEVSRTFGKDAQGLFVALTGGDEVALTRYIEELLSTSSFLDFSSAGKHYPEQAYHMLLLGYLWILHEQFDCRSNRESGDGRPDLLLLPKRNNQVGVVVECKRAGPQDTGPLEDLALEAIAQVDSQRYKQELMTRPLTHIVLVGIAFDGKRCAVRCRRDPVEPPPPRSKSL